MDVGKDGRVKRGTIKGEMRMVGGKKKEQMRRGGLRLRLMNGDKRCDTGCVRDSTSPPRLSLAMLPRAIIRPWPRLSRTVCL